MKVDSINSLVMRYLVIFRRPFRGKQLYYKVTSNIVLTVWC